MQQSRTSIIENIRRLKAEKSRLFEKLREKNSQIDSAYTILLCTKADMEYERYNELKSTVNLYYDDFNRVKEKLNSKYNDLNYINNEISDLYNDKERCYNSKDYSGANRIKERIAYLKAKKSEIHCQIQSLKNQRDNIWCDIARFKSAVEILKEKRERTRASIERTSAAIIILKDEKAQIKQKINNVNCEIERLGQILSESRNIH